MRARAAHQRGESGQLRRLQYRTSGAISTHVQLLRSRYRTSVFLYLTAVAAARYTYVYIRSVLPFLRELHCHDGFRNYLSLVDNVEITPEFPRRFSPARIILTFILFTRDNDFRRLSNSSHIQIFLFNVHSKARIYTNSHWRANSAHLSTQAILHTRALYHPLASVDAALQYRIPAPLRVTAKVHNVSWTITENKSSFTPTQWLQCPHTHTCQSIIIPCLHGRLHYIDRFMNQPLLS